MKGYTLRCYADLIIGDSEKIVNCCILLNIGCGGAGRKGMAGKGDGIRNDSSCSVFRFC